MSYPELGEVISNSELKRQLAGGDCFIRTKNNQIRGLAITPKLNPEGPEIIVVGTGREREKRSEMLSRSGRSYPIFLKAGKDRWEFRGFYRCSKFDQTPEVILNHRRHRKGDISGVLFMLPDQEQREVEVVFPKNPEVRKKSEQAAIQVVTEHYQKLGYSIDSKESENLGFDLIADNKTEILKIEVKGTTSEDPRFFLTRNERLGSADPSWRLAIVTNSLGNPCLQVLRREEMERRFHFEPLAWQCMPRASKRSY